MGIFWWKSKKNKPVKKGPKAMFKFVLVDLTTDETSSDMRPYKVFDKMIQAFEEQLDLHYAEHYGIPLYMFRIATGPNDRKSDEIGINFRDTIPEASDALAYHTVVNGIPDIEIGVDLFGSLIKGQEAVSGGVSHEIIETLGDEGANGWKDTFSGKMNAEELCDFVQNTGYEASNGVYLSNFVKPNFFVPGSNGPWDHMGVMKHQEDVSNGYGIQCAAPERVSQIGGMSFKATNKLSIVGIAKKEKHHQFSRAYRRGVRHHAVS